MSWNDHVPAEPPTTPPVPPPGMGPEGTPGILLIDPTSGTREAPSEVRLLVAIYTSPRAYSLSTVEVGVRLTSLQPSRATPLTPGLLMAVDL